jgi:mannose-6-phosphate isomerase
MSVGSAGNAAVARPVTLPANQPAQFYRGGASIAELRGTPQTSDFLPEDWVASTTVRFGQESSGLSPLPDGTVLRAAVQADPESWLGAAHLAAFGADTRLLVKLLDAGQRLPVHCHPSNAFAQEHFASHYGKTEAWVVIGTHGASPTVHIGFQEDVDRERLDRWVTEQDTTAMLDALNPTTVAAGDTVFIPAGLPHAIGEGVFIVELQQPTDFSVTLEWSGFLADAANGHLGIGFETALGCVDRTGWGNGRWETLVRHTSGRADAVVDLFDGTSADFFRADRITANAPVDLEPSFAVLVALNGEGTLRTEHGGTLQVRKGDTIVVPHAAGGSTVDGGVTAIRCRPSAPKTAPQTNGGT